MNRITRIAMTVIMMAACTAMAFAQAKQDGKQRMTRERLAEAQAKYIARALALDDETAARYVRTYGECQKEVWALGPRAKKKSRQNMTEAEAKQAITERMEHSEKLLSIRKKYYKEYSKFMTQKQIERAYEMEKTSMKKLAAKHKMKKRPGMSGKAKPAGKKSKK